MAPQRELRPRPVMESRLNNQNIKAILFTHGYRSVLSLRYNPPYYFGQGLSLAGSLPRSLGWLGTEPQGAPVPVSPALGLQALSTCSTFFCAGCGDRTQVLKLALYCLSALPCQCFFFVLNKTFKEAFCSYESPSVLK